MKKLLRSLPFVLMAGSVLPQSSLQFISTKHSAKYLLRFFVFMIPLWALAQPTAVSFPTGFNCGGLTNEKNRAACYLSQGRRDPTTSVFSSPAPSTNQQQLGANTITGSFSVGFPCERLTNVQARLACFSSQGRHDPNTAVTKPDSTTERDRLTAEVEAERKKRQALEQQLAAVKERESITAELDFERKKRQELEEQFRQAQQSNSIPTQTTSSNLPVCPWLGYLDNCFGPKTEANGNKYVGEFKDGKYNGQGTFTYVGGEKYIGEFKDGKYNGQGTVYASNGSITNQGIWADNKFVRSASVQQASVANQTSSTSTVQPNFTQTNVPACEGSDDARWSNCFGTKTYLYGSKYDGEWNLGKFNGQGTMTYSRGDKYVGEFKNGLFNGGGTYYSLSGAVVDQGMWVDGKLVRSAPVLQAIAPSVLPSSAERDRIVAEVEAERKKRQELEQQLAAVKERDRITADLEAERRKRQELEEQLRVAQPRPVASQTASNSSIGKRIALVVGNGNYKIRPLKNSKNDADDFSRSLKATGFEVIDLRDATLPQMRTAVRQFGDRLINNDVGLVYYSGHGVEVKGRNYFIPVNADIQREDEIADQGLDVSLILEKMSTAGKGVNILIVDACRDDPFGRSFRSSSRGLAQMDAPRGTIIAYATSPGKVASDGDPRERNSPYTKHLVKAMQSPNKPIEQVFKEVRRAVQDETKNQQTPWENTSLSGDFFFRVQK